MPDDTYTLSADAARRLGPVVRAVEQDTGNRGQRRGNKPTAAIAGHARVTSSSPAAGTNRYAGKIVVSNDNVNFTDYGDCWVTDLNGAALSIRRYKVHFIGVHTDGLPILSVDVDAACCPGPLSTALGTSGCCDSLGESCQEYGIWDYGGADSSGTGGSLGSPDPTYSNCCKFCCWFIRGVGCLPNLQGMPFPGSPVYAWGGGRPFPINKPGNPPPPPPPPAPPDCGCTSGPFGNGLWPDGHGNFISFASCCTGGTGGGGTGGNMGGGGSGGGGNGGSGGNGTVNGLICHGQWICDGTGSNGGCWCSSSIGGGGGLKSAGGCPGCGGAGAIIPSTAPAASVPTKGGCDCGCSGGAAMLGCASLGAGILGGEAPHEAELFSLLQASGAPASTNLTLNTQFADANNSGAAETDLYTYTLPANTLTANGDSIEANFHGIINGGSLGNATFRPYFGGTSLGAVALAVPGVGTTSVGIKSEVMRTGTSTARASFSLTDESGTTKTVYIALTGLDFTTTNTVKWTGQASNTGDITAKKLRIVKIPAP